MYGAGPPWQLLPIQKISRDMTVRRRGLLEQASRFHAVAVPAVGDQRTGVAPFGRAFPSVGVEQRRQLRVPIQGEQATREEIAVALVVVRVETQQFSVMADGLVVVTGRPQRLGQPAAGAHVGTGFQHTPEVADILLERRRTDGPLAGFHTLPVQLDRFRGRLRRVFGEQDPGIGAQRRSPQGLLGQDDPPPTVGGFPRRVHQLLGIREGIVA